MLADQQKTYIHPLSEETRCHLEGLPTAIADGTGGERVNGIRAVGTS